MAAPLPPPQVGGGVTFLSMWSHEGIHMYTAHILCVLYKYTTNVHMYYQMITPHALLLLFLILGTLSCVSGQHNRIWRQRGSPFCYLFSHSYRSCLSSFTHVCFLPAFYSLSSPILYTFPQPPLPYSVPPPPSSAHMHTHIIDYASYIHLHMCDVHKIYST